AAQMIADVNAQGALFVVNHPILDLGAACIGCFWKHADTPWAMVSAVEVETGNYTQWKELFETPQLQYWDTQLDAGFRLAAVGGSDDHRAGTDTSATASEIGTPTTLVYATELSEAALLDGIRNGRTQVALRGPEDPLVELTTADGKMIGDDVAGSRIAVIAHVTGGNGLQLALVENGTQTQEAPVDADDWKHTFHVAVPKTGERVRAHLTDGDDAIVVTSHLWLSYQPSSGCSIAAPSAQTWGGLALMALAALALAARRFSRAPASRRR
ncbi:MAG TPA: CehA/McbA family metallohydrolase, partial [Polyangia bacterium]